MTERDRGLRIKDPEAYVLRPQPGDVFVLKTPHTLSGVQRAYWIDMMRSVMPDCKVLLLDNGAELQLIKNGNHTEENRPRQEGRAEADN